MEIHLFSLKDSFKFRNDFIQLRYIMLLRILIETFLPYSQKCLHSIRMGLAQYVTMCAIESNNKRSARK